MNIAYVIIHRTGKFGLDIKNWICMSTFQKTWVGFKQLFLTAHQELRETTYINVKYVGINHTNMVRNVITLLKQVLQQEQALTGTPPIIPE